MRRRECFVGILIAATPSVLLAAKANKVYRLAVCSQFGMDSFSNSFWMRLFNRLRQVGYTESDRVGGGLGSGGIRVDEAAQCQRDRQIGIRSRLPQPPAAASARA